MLLRIAACHKDMFPVVNHGGDKLFRGTIEDPMAFASAWVVTRHTEAAGENHLGAIAYLTNNGRDITTGLVLSHGAPALFAGLRVECDEVGIAVVIAVDDDQVFEQDWASVESMSANKGTNISFPLLVSFEIVSRNDDPARRDHSLRTHIGRDDFFSFGEEKGDGQ